MHLGTFFSNTDRLQGRILYKDKTQIFWELLYIVSSIYEILFHKRQQQQQQQQSSWWEEDKRHYFWDMKLWGHFVLFHFGNLFKIFLPPSNFHALSENTEVRLMYFITKGWKLLGL